MSLLVVDASCLASWLLPSQATPAARALRARIALFDLIGPAHLRLELRSLLLKAERRGALTASQTLVAVADVEQLAIDLVADVSDEELDMALGLARTTSLSFYDALYLQLAQAEGAALASRDAALLAAAQARGVRIEDCR